MFINFKTHIVSESIKDNLVQHFLYKLAFVFSHIFKYFRITPNQITFSSILLCLISCYFLYNNQITLFLILWYISHFLDYCDGTLARLTAKTTKSLLRVDHFVDLIRIVITFLFISLFYNSNIIWVLTIVFLSLFFLSQILSLEYDAKKQVNPNFKYIISINKKNVFFKHFYNIFFTFNGHTLFILGFIFINDFFAISIFCYLIFLNLKNMYSPLQFLIKNKRKQ